MALAACVDLMSLDIRNTDINQPVSFQEQRSAVQELSGSTLSKDNIKDEVKDAFLKLLAVRLGSATTTHTCHALLMPHYTLHIQNLSTYTHLPTSGSTTNTNE